VATGESSVTTLSEDLAGAIQARHGFDELVPGNRLAGGYANDVFRADRRRPTGRRSSNARVRRILEVIRTPYDRRVDWDYQLANLDAFERLG
jgi:hypothetical protein